MRQEYDVKNAPIIASWNFTTDNFYKEEIAYHDNGAPDIMRRLMLDPNNALRVNTFNASTLRVVKRGLPTDKQGYQEAKQGPVVNIGGIFTVDTTGEYTLFVDTGTPDTSETNVGYLLLSWLNPNAFVTLEAGKPYSVIGKVAMGTLSFKTEHEHGVIFVRAYNPVTAQLQWKGPVSEVCTAY